MQQSEPLTAAQAATGRYINSVSDLLYSTDEIEFLLDDIRDLEPTSCKPEDIQDFEIAGSRTGALSSAGGGSATGVAAAGSSAANAAGDCPGGGGGCEDCESPLDGTVNSWDSHSHYRRRAASPDLSLYSGVIVYCDHTHLKTPTGFVRILLLVTTIACLACLCTSGTIKVGLFMLPLVGRLRLMMFVTLLSLFITCLLLFLDISHVVYLFPFNWGKVNAYLYVSLSVLFLIASSLIFHTIFLSEAFTWVPKWTHHQLLITGCLGYLCCFQSAILSLIQKCTADNYQPVAEDPSMNLQERQLLHQTSLQNSPEHHLNTINNKQSVQGYAQTAHPTVVNQNQTTHNYKPLVNYREPQQPEMNRAASTSRQQHQETVNYLLDDVQPCSSKSSDPYRMVA